MQCIIPGHVHLKEACFPSSTVYTVQICLQKLCNIVSTLNAVSTFKFVSTCNIVSICHIGTITCNSVYLQVPATYRTSFFIYREIKKAFVPPIISVGRCFNELVTKIDDSQNGVILAILGVPKMAHGISGAWIEIPRPLFNTNQPPKPPKRHLRNPNRPSKSDFWPFCIFWTFKRNFPV